MVIDNIESMKYRDALRERHPTARIVTRAVAHQCNRRLDRILATTRLARHQHTRSAVYEGEPTMKGSDHKLVIFWVPAEYLLYFRELPQL